MSPKLVQKKLDLLLVKKGVPPSPKKTNVTAKAKLDVAPEDEEVQLKVADQKCASVPALPSTRRRAQPLRKIGEQKNNKSALPPPKSPKKKPPASIASASDDALVEPARTPAPKQRVSHSHHITTPEVVKEKAAARRKPALSEADPRQPKITASLVVRKSSRMLSVGKKDEELLKIQRMILDGKEEPRIEVKELPGKGRGLVARERFERNEFVVEYAGELVSQHEAKRRELSYANEPEKHIKGCYMYYFKHKGVTKCVDATAETIRYGRLLNHSRLSPNLRTEVIEIVKAGGPVPYLILRAVRDIEAGEELVYDYGDRSPASLAAFPWLKD